MARGQPEKVLVIRLEILLAEELPDIVQSQPEQSLNQEDFGAAPGLSGATSRSAAETRRNVTLTLRRIFVKLKNKQKNSRCLIQLRGKVIC